MSHLPKHQLPIFHPGEQSLQAAEGVLERIQAVGAVVVRDHMPQQHQLFYEGLSYVFLGASDEDGAPWASVFVGRPGFMGARGDKLLEVSSKPGMHDPIAGALKPNAPVGILGLDLSNRRRNRASAQIERVSADGLILSISQTIGNCPKYIQQRELTTTLATAMAQDGRAGQFAFRSWSDPRVRALVGTSDTFFIASQALPPHSSLTSGVDVSHRGGRPGFVRMDTDKSLVFPDFKGNSIFMTLGNLQVDPRAGVLVIDFETGDVVTMTGRAYTLPEIDASHQYPGARAVVRFELVQGYFLAKHIPLRWRLTEESPFLQASGGWAV